jgi:hypothetical protein
VGQHVNVFSFDFQYDDPALKTLKAYYNITKTPTMILDFNDKKEGYFSFGELLAYYNER